MEFIESLFRSADGALFQSPKPYPFNSKCRWILWNEEFIFGYMPIDTIYSLEKKYISFPFFLNCKYEIWYLGEWRNFWPFLQQLFCVLEIFKKKKKLYFYPPRCNFYMIIVKSCFSFISKQIVTWIFVTWIIWDSLLFYCPGSVNRKIKWNRWADKRFSFQSNSTCLVFFFLYFFLYKQGLVNHLQQFKVWSSLHVFSI